MKSPFSGRGRQTPAERWRDWVESLSMQLAVPDAGPARAQALKWLGDRYLLARPINRTSASVYPDDRGSR